MWNHAPKMAEALDRRGLSWPRFAPDEAADLAAYLLTKRMTALEAPPPKGR